LAVALDHNVGYVQPALLFFLLFFPFSKKKNFTDEVSLTKQIKRQNFENELILKLLNCQK